MCGIAGASDIIYRRSASKYHRVDVKDALHLDFADMNFWGGPLRERGPYGKIDPGRAALGISERQDTRSRA